MEDVAYWMALHRAPGIGPRRLKKLLEVCKSPRNVIKEGERNPLIKKIIPPGALNYLKNPEWPAIEKELNWLTQQGVQILTLDHPLYPNRLKEIAAPPAILYVRGNVDLLRKPQIAIVGSRNPSPAGLENAFQFAKSLSNAGLVVVSGMALGIDGASHKGALQHDQPTIAVSGTGIDKVYPRQHKDLADQIAQHGAIVTEFSVGTRPLPHHFPRRNRIISGLSLGVLVVEAGIQSGSLITARFALEQGRDVFAIPGSIHNALARGNHSLIKQGAKLVETVDDILDELPAELLQSRSTTVTEHSQPVSDTLSIESIKQNETFRVLIDQLGYDPVSIDVLVDRAGLTAETISSMLLVLEMHGLATSTSGLYTRVGGKDR